MQLSARLTATALLLSLLAMGQGCGRAPASESLTKPVTLTIWRTFEDEDVLRDTMTAYSTLHPNVSFDYRQVRSEEYKQALLRAFAEGTGPDIFSIHNSWLGEYQSLMAPLPKTLKIPYTETKGTIKKEKVTTVRDEPTITLRQLKSEFVDVVTDDVVRSYQATTNSEAQDRIFGLPLSVDTLALFYNKDLLNAAGIAEPPKTWDEFLADVIKMSSVGPNDQIIQSGAAIGTSRNVERAVDILSLLMLQTGTQMTSDRGRAAFSQAIGDRSIPGAEAIRFYTNFASPLTQAYSWNAAQPSSFEAFASGKTAFFFGYSYHAPLIRNRAQKLRFGISEAPQTTGGRVINYANYWVESISKASKNQTWAWDFVQFAAKPEQAQKYLDSAKKPPARRAMISKQLENEDLAPFANQVLTAKSWYHGNDAGVMEQAILDAIDSVLSGTEAENALRTAENKVNQTL